MSCENVIGSEELRGLGAGAVVASDVDVPVVELGNGRDDLEIGRLVRFQSEGALEVVRVIGALRGDAAAVGDVDVQPAEGVSLYFLGRRSNDHRGSACCVK